MRIVMGLALALLTGAASAGDGFLNSLVRAAGREYREEAQRSVILDPSARYVVGFTPKRAGQNAALDVALTAVNEAQKTCVVALYGFTSKPLAVALVNALKRGVDVRVIADEESNQKSYSAVTFVANNGVPTRLNGNYKIFHHKFAVIDGVSVEMGSFNWTEAASKQNAEDAVYLRNVPEIAAQYQREWITLWKEAQDYGRRY